MTEAASSCTCFAFSRLGCFNPSDAMCLIFGDVIGSALVGEALDLVAIL